MILPKQAYAILMLRHLQRHSVLLKVKPQIITEATGPFTICLLPTMTSVTFHHTLSLILLQSHWLCCCFQKTVCMLPISELCTPLACTMMLSPLIATKQLHSLPSGHPWPFYSPQSIYSHSLFYFLYNTFTIIAHIIITCLIAWHLQLSVIFKGDNIFVYLLYPEEWKVYNK